jgi:hypothetical protein
VEAHLEILRRFPLSAILNPQSGINSSVYFRFKILHLLRSSFAAAIRPLFNQFVGRHGVKRNHRPIRVSSNQSVGCGTVSQAQSATESDTQSFSAGHMML